MNKASFDIAILGGGINGSLFALNIKRKAPQLRVLIIEKQAKFSDKIGESTSDVSSVFLNRLGIDHILKKHARKSGLRFLFFENGKRLEFASPSQKSIANGYHFDRKILDTDLLEECKKKGVVVWQPAEITRLEILEDENHIFVQKDRHSLEATAKWFIDVSGRFRFLQKKLNLENIPLDLDTGAVATHFDNIPANQSWDTPEHPIWTERCIGSQDYSTIHFMRKGCWWWFIKINETRASVGMVYNKDVIPSSEAQNYFLKQIKEDSVISKALQNANPNKINHIDKLPYMVRQYHHKNTALLGDSGAFIDPLFSPGLDFVCQQNEYLSDLIIDYYKTGKKNKRKWDKYNRIIFKANKDRVYIYKQIYSYTHSYDLFSNIAEYIFLGYQTFSVLPLRYFPKRMRKISTLNFITQPITQLYFLRLRTLLKKRKKENKTSSALPQPVRFSRVGMPSGIRLFIKPFDLFWAWCKDFMLLNVK